MSVLPEQEFGCNQIYCEQVVYTREKGDEGTRSKELAIPQWGSTVCVVDFFFEPKESNHFLRRAGPAENITSEPR